MKPGRKKKMERLVASISKKMECSQTIPDGLFDRILKFSILSFSILLLGVYMGINIKSMNFVFWSIAISAFGFFRAGRLLWIANRKDYELVEGTVFQIKGKHSIGQMCQVCIEMKNGQTTQLLMDKRQNLQVGKRYRFYFNKRQDTLSGIKKLDAMLNINSFYGYEEIEQEHGE